MVLCLCACEKEVTDNSSQEIEYEHEQIYVDADGNPIEHNPINSSTESDTQDQSSDTSSKDDATSDDSTSNTSSSNKIEIDYETVVEVDLCDDVIRGYLDADTAARQYSWLSEYSGIQYDKPALELDWYFDGSYLYTLTFSEKSDFSNPIVVETKFSNLENVDLIPGKTYYWKVVGSWSSELLGGGKIHIKDAPVRWIKVGGTGNVRDMGGWKAENGKTVKYGMMYRGQKLENVTEEGLATIKKLGWKTELDLRYKSQMFQKEGTGMNYVFIETNTQYDATLKRDAETVKASYRKIFELLSDERNYPFYSHCSAGADRTGTFAFITNGVLGVSYEDLTRDFELTSFSSSGKRWRGQGNGGTFLEGDDVMQEDSNNTVAWGRLYKEMMKYGADNGYTTLQESIQYWLTSYVGVPKSQIDSFKRIMLE